jgi:hypothetical protein
MPSRHDGAVSDIASCDAGCASSPLHAKIDNDERARETIE